MKNKKGFTFIETLVVIGIVAILATTVVVAVNPTRRFEDARDKQREIHLQTILNAVNQKRAVEGRDCDNMPNGVDATTSLPIFKTIGTGDEKYNLFSCLVPFYLDNALYDPAEGSKEDTKYQIWQNPYTKRVTVRYIKDNKEIAAGPKEYWIFGVPIVETGTTSTITHFTAEIIDNEVKEEKGASVFVSGVIWHTDSEPDYNNNLGRTVESAGVSKFNSTITGLSGNNRYYFRAYAKNDIGVGYGEVKWFETPDLRPVVETLTATDVTDKTAVLQGKILTLGEAPVTTYFCWGENEGIVENCSGVNKISGEPGTINVPVSFSAFLGKDELIIDDLESKDYYFKACGHNNSGDRCGGIVSFTIQKGKPYVMTLDPDDGYGEVSAKWAKVEGEIKSDGGYPITKKGICFSYEANSCNFDPDTNPNCKESEGEVSPGVFFVTIPDSEPGDPDLQPGNEYNICAYARNDENDEKGLSYGGMENFQAKFTAPDVRITGVTPSHSSAEVWGIIDSDGGKTIPQKGICWRSSLAGDPKKLDPTQNTTNCTNDGSGKENQPFKSTISTGPDGLFGNTTYNVRAYAINGTGAMWIGWSDLVQFNPILSISPKLTTYTVNLNDVDNKSALIKGRITDHGGAEINAMGFCWTINLSHTTQTLIPDPKPADVDCGSLLIQNLINFGDFSYKAIGLYAGREYKTQAYARNIKGYGYGGVQNFETKEAVKSTLATNPGTTVISSGDDWVKISGNLISNGGDNGTIIGVCYSSSTQYQNPTYPPDNVNVFCDTRTTNGEVGSFEFTINGLKPGITYYALTFANNSAGTVYGIPSKSFNVGRENGTSCTDFPDGSKCKSSFCVDGVCCNSACDGNCNRCNVAGSLGTCTDVASDCTGNCDVCTSGNCAANATLCTGNCDVCSGSGTVYNCAANVNLCDTTGNCEQCSGSGTAFNCGSKDTDCTGNCDVCSGTGLGPYNCAASAALCTGNCDTCSGSGNVFNCAASNALCSNTDSSCYCSGSGTAYNCVACQCKSCSNYSCSSNKPDTNWGAGLYNCSGSNERCYAGFCRTCPTIRYQGGYLSADGCNGCAGQGGLVCWRPGGYNQSCTSVCTNGNFGGCVVGHSKDGVWYSGLWKDTTDCAGCRGLRSPGSEQSTPGCSSGTFNFKPAGYLSSLGYNYYCEYNSANTVSCDALNTSYQRICACQY